VHYLVKCFPCYTSEELLADLSWGYYYPYILDAVFETSQNVLRPTFTVLSLELLWRSFPYIGLDVQVVFWTELALTIIYGVLVVVGYFIVKKRAVDQHEEVSRRVQAFNDFKAEQRRPRGV